MNNLDLDQNIEHSLVSDTEICLVVKQLRREKGYTQQVMADKMGISQKTYSSLERNAHKASFHRVQKLLKLLDASIAIKP